MRFSVNRQQGTRRHHNKVRPSAFLKINGPVFSPYLRILTLEFQIVDKTTFDIVGFSKCKSSFDS